MGGAEYHTLVLAAPSTETVTCSNGKVCAEETPNGRASSDPSLKCMHKNIHKGVDESNKQTGRQTKADRDFEQLPREPHKAIGPNATAGALH